MERIQNLIINGKIRPLIDSIKFIDNVTIQEELKILKEYTSFYTTDDIKIRFQIFKNNLTKNQLTCKNINCQNQVNFCPQKYKFKDYCSVKCMSTCATTKQKAIETSLEKYGVTSPNKTIEKKNQIVTTNLEKYGTSCVFSNKDIIDKIQDSHISKFGVHYSQQHIQNLDNWNDKEFIQENFLDKDNYLKMKEFGDYFNCQYSNIYNKFKSLNIEFKKIAGFSIGEKEVLEYITSLECSTIENARHIINKELDIYIPSNNIAIEYNGLFWHSYGLNNICENSQQSDLVFNKNRHLIKTEDCLDKDIQLFHIFENEWNNPGSQDIWKSVLSNALDKNTTRIGARKCTIKEIVPNISNKFLEENHLQGNDNSSIRLGLYYNDELVSLMTFGKPRYSTNKKISHELIRFCNKKYYQIPGAASKLLKYFERNYFPRGIVSYANRRWSTGQLYRTLEFKEINISKPNYFYFQMNSDLLESRVKYQKHKLVNILQTFSEEKTEMQNMIENDYRIIWDSGNYVFEKVYN